MILLLCIYSNVIKTLLLIATVFFLYLSSFNEQLLHILGIVSSRHFSRSYAFYFLNIKNCAAQTLPRPFCYDNGASIKGLTGSIFVTHIVIITGAFAAPFLMLKTTKDTVQGLFGMAKRLFEVRCYERAREILV